MSKLRTSRVAVKYFKKIGTGRLTRSKAYRFHILTEKSTKRRRNLRRNIIIDAIGSKVVKKILPYL